jgi:hypothetical protein
MYVWAACRSNAALTKELKDLTRAADELKKKNSSLLEENKNLTRALSKEIGEGRAPLLHRPDLA